MSRLHLPIVLLLISLSLALGASRPNDLIVGSRQPGDILIQRELAKKSSSILQIVKLTKTYPGDNYHNITQVKLLDQDKKGNGATAKILNGGPKYSYVTVKFTSQRGSPIDFIVELYGK